MTGVLIAAISVSGTLLAVYLGQRWGREAAVVAEERQARRDERRRIMEPINQFLEQAARASAFQIIKFATQAAYEQLRADLPESMTREDFEKVALEGVEGEPVHEPRLAHGYFVASTAAPTRAMAVALLVVYSWVLYPESEGAVQRLRQAILKARRLVDDYIVDGVDEAEVGQEQPVK